jgi:hypothetical protein
MQRSGGFQLIGPSLAWTTSLYIWRGQLDKARKRVSEGLSRIAAKEPDLIYNAELYALALRVEAESDGPDSATAQAVLLAMDEAIGSVPGEPPPEAFAFRELARAEMTRILRAPDPARWRAAGDAFRALDQLYQAAYADFRAAEALSLTGARRERIAEPLRAAHAAALEMEALPCKKGSRRSPQRPA